MMVTSHNSRRRTMLVASAFVTSVIPPNLAFADSPKSSISVTEETMSLGSSTIDFKSSTYLAIKKLFDALRNTDEKLHEAEEKIRSLAEEFTALRSYWPDPKTVIDQVYNRVVNSSSSDRAEEFLDKLTIRVTRFEKSIIELRDVVAEHDSKIASHEKTIAELSSRVAVLEKTQASKPITIATAATSTRPAFQSEPVLMRAPPVGAIQVDRCVDMHILGKSRHGSLYTPPGINAGLIFVEHKKTR